MNNEPWKPRKFVAEKVIWVDAKGELVTVPRMVQYHIKVTVWGWIEQARRASA